MLNAITCFFVRDGSTAPPTTLTFFFKMMISRESLCVGNEVTIAVKNVRSKPGVKLGFPEHF
jgi:hypothetical protein